jgi:hypothetical protein
MEGFALACIFVAFLFYRDFRKAGLAASFFVGLSLCFEQVRIFANLGFAYIFHQPLEDIVVVFFFIAFILGFIFLLLKSDKANPEEDAKLNRLTGAFNIMCSLMLVLNIVPIAASYYEQSIIQNEFVTKYKEPFTKLHPKPTKGKRDVYLIVLDACANRETLVEFGGYDNREFLDWLKQKGFYVVPHAKSNYDRTPFSMSSVLNMQYIDSVSAKMGQNFQADNIYYRMIQFSAVWHLFKQCGYKYINTASGAFATDYVPCADDNLRADMGNHFATAIMMLSPLCAIEKYVPLMRDSYARRRLAPRYVLPQILKKKGPKFVLIHTDLSHPPALFTATGEKLPLPRHLLNDESTEFKPYTEQLKFCQKEVKEWLEAILNSYPSDMKPIIILESDHGPYYPCASKEKYFNEVMRILNAYYFPDVDNQGLYPTITPVNSFRVLFNDYFDLKLPMLKDQSFCSPVRIHPYQWSDVTDCLKFPLADKEKPVGHIRLEGKPVVSR